MHCRVLPDHAWGLDSRYAEPDSAYRHPVTQLRVTGIGFITGSLTNSSSVSPVIRLWGKQSGKPRALVEMAAMAEQDVL